MSKSFEVQNDSEAQTDQVVKLEDVLRVEAIGKILKNEIRKKNFCYGTVHSIIKLVSLKHLSKTMRDRKCRHFIGKHQGF